MLRVNVGCGRTATPGWLNLDSSLTVRLARTPLARLLPSNPRAFAKAVVAQGVRYGDATRLPLADGSVDAVYSSHMLEHLSRDKAERFLREAARVLKPGGVLRIAVPDLRKGVDAYLGTGDADAFMEWSILSSPLDTLRQRLRALIVGTTHHLWHYDGASLKRTFERHGFANVAVMEPGATNISEPGELDLYERAEESVFVEGVRP